MSTVTHSAKTSVVDFYDREVAPALYARLDAAFPEFAWKWDGHSWVARKRYTGHSGRPRRVTSNGPHGFDVEGGESMTWLAYVSGGDNPRGRSYSEAVRKLAALAGVDCGVLDDPAETPRHALHHTMEQETPQERLLDVFFLQAQEALRRHSAQSASEAIEQRWGFDIRAVGDPPLGYYTTPEDVRQRLVAAGFTTSEVDQSGLAADGRCTHRLVLPARDEHGELLNFFARELTHAEDDPCPDLHLKRLPTPALFGLDVALAEESGGHANLLLVADRVEATWFHWRGVWNVAALSPSKHDSTLEPWLKLARLNVATVTVAMDQRGKSPAEIFSLVDEAVELPDGPEVYLLDSGDLGRHRTWQSLVRKEGTGPLHAAIERRTHALTYQAAAIVDRYKSAGKWTEQRRQSAIAEANRYCSTLPDAREEAVMRHFWPAFHRLLPAVEIPAPRVSYPEPPGRVVFDSHETNGAVRAEPPKPIAPIAINVRSLSDDLPAHAEHLTKMQRRGIVGLAQQTLPTFDSHISGMRGLMLLAGGPSVGKTSLSMQLVVDAVARNEDACCVIVSLDMSRWDLITRLKSRLARLDWKSLVTYCVKDGLTYEAEESFLLRQADRELANWSDRVRILDQQNCPCPTVEQIQAHIDDLKKRTGATRAIVLIDDLQAWPLAAGNSRTIADVSAWDGWHVNQLKQLRDFAGETAVLAVTEVPGTGGIAEHWDADLVRALGSQRLAYVADMVHLLRPFTPQEIQDEFASLLFPSVPQSQWLSTLRSQGIALSKLRIAKGREGVECDDLAMAFHYRQFRFDENLPRWEFSSPCSDD